MTSDDIASHLYLIFADDVPLCGCGDPQSARALVHQILSLAPLYENQRYKEAEARCGTNGAYYVVMGLLTNAGLLEHGTVIGGSWLTDRGRWLLWAVDQLGGIDNIAHRLDEAGYPHDWDREKHAMQECVDACWTIPAPATT
ncbi:hypothetical protein RVR_8303 [Actinacidiphila reveromycinica]|uniref:Uncharacterized protein n=1 Tax=Actinacidiphila reveromycinica TaxID=659352 RepID=A0A7U3UYM7_9ACTN|nr:hypothetical protein [Streptomyces sp. SN-593]BBB01062.1 hypothetical protein RVR_8303 [Streptomyces sp. SN-593]